MNHEFFMNIALEEAAKYRSTVKSNPMVGAVLTKNNAVVAKSAHQYFGGNHAEINLIQNYNESFKDCTLYLTFTMENMLS